MEKNSSLNMKMLPWLLIVFGFLTLDMYQGYLAIACMVIGIVYADRTHLAREVGNRRNNSKKG